MVCQWFLAVDVCTSIWQWVGVGGPRQGVEGGDEEGRGERVESGEKRAAGRRGGRAGRGPGEGGIYTDLGVCHSHSARARRFKFSLFNSGNGREKGRQAGRAGERRSKKRRGAGWSGVLNSSPGRD